MAGSLKDALIRSGAISPEQLAEMSAKEERDREAAEKVRFEEEMRRDAEAKKAIRANAAAVKMRKGLGGQAFFKWCRNGRAPINAEQMCCMCGREGYTQWDAFKAITAPLRRPRGADEGGNFLDLLDEGSKKAAEIGKDGSLLIPFDIGSHLLCCDAPHMLSAKNIAVLRRAKQICLKCFRAAYPIEAEKMSKGIAARREEAHKVPVMTLAHAALLGGIIEDAIKEEEAAEGRRI